MIHERIQGWKQKLSNLVTRRISLLRAGLAGRQGFEPRYADPESAVLPLNDLPALVRSPPEWYGESRFGAVSNHSTTCARKLHNPGRRKNVRGNPLAVRRSRATIPRRARACAPP